MASAQALGQRQMKKLVRRVRIHREASFDPELAALRELPLPQVLVLLQVAAQ